MSMNTLTNIDQIRELPRDQLLKLWRKNFRRKEPPRVKTLLWQELAYKIQSHHSPGWDAETQRLIQSVIRQNPTLPKTTSAEPNVTLTKTKRRPKQQLKEGTKLLRSWNGYTYEVTVLEGGKQFKFHDKTYKSLTIIAKLITGTHWSGPRFFGLNKITETK